MPQLQPQLSVLALLLMLCVACRDASSLRVHPTPTTVVRAGELYTCSNGVEDCRVTDDIGPVTRNAGSLRVEFRVTLDGPSGGTTSWTNDTAMHDQLKREGGRGIGLSPVSTRVDFYELVAVGGIASADVTLVAPVTYQGFWVFMVPDPPGTLLLLTYPDFIEAPVPIVVPE
jgi:hypothetical protein